MPPRLIGVIFERLHSISPSRASVRTPVQNLVQTIRSDDLPKLAAVLGQIAVFKDHVNVFQVDLILDANIVIRDLLWLARKRTNPAARTELMELMDCEVVRAHAPFFLVRELNVNLPLLAKDNDLDVKLLRALWKQYRKRIRLVPVGGPAKTKDVADPKDVPYLRLQKKLSYPIASEDPHIAAMGGNVVRIQVFGALRAYSRHAAVEYQFKVTGAGSAIMLAVMAESGIALLKRIPTLPKPVLWGGVALIGLLLAHPTSRKRILEIGAGLFQGGAQALEATFGALEPLLEEHRAAQQAARLNLTKAQSALCDSLSPAPTSVTAVVI